MLVLSAERPVGDAGYTLVEVLGTAVIIIVLSLLAIQSLDGVVDRTLWAKSRDELRTIEMALERHRADHGHYPDRLFVLVDKGYLRSGTGLVSPWSPSNSAAVYYFYAVDDLARPLAYALGDPGPRAACGADPATLHADTSFPLPCGRSPALPAWQFGGMSPSLSLNGTPELVGGRISLRRFRASCGSVQVQPWRPETGCDLKTES